MIGMNILLNGDAAWPDLKESKDAIILMGNEAPTIDVAVLNEGMRSGRPSVALRINLPDGRPVVVETSAVLFCSAAKAIMAKYPDLFA